MVNIGTSDKITNLWPVSPNSPARKPGLQDKSSHHQQQKNKRKDKNKVEDGPGKNVDEYA
ncbi:MAG: hypothetical protein OEY78_07180 [Gammaproteobacteria bacterium]|nr:hypothetical protein [Gammaproteobacteria bacterium]